MRARFLALFMTVLFSHVALAETKTALPPKDVFFSILAGGGGTRLWPFSRDHKPKQLLALGSDLNLVEQSILRLEHYSGFDQANLNLATARNIEAQMKSVLTGLNLKANAYTVSDPSRRDTGPAILLNVLEALKQNPEAIVAFIPADPFIPVEQSKDFTAAIETALNQVHQNPSKIVLLGKKPTFPATQYGYIEQGAAEGSFSAVRSFKEKPNEKVATEFVKNGSYLWNMGIFVAKANFFADLFKTYAPEIYGPVSDYMRTRNDADYNRALSVSVDIAVMQPAAKDNHLLVEPVSFHWEDVGDVQTYAKIHTPHLQRTGEAAIVIEKDASGNSVIASKGKLVVLVDVQGLCVMEEGNAQIIIPCDKSQKIKDVVKQLQSDPALKQYVD